MSGNVPLRPIFYSSRSTILHICITPRSGRLQTSCNRKIPKQLVKLKRSRPAKTTPPSKTKTRDHSTGSTKPGSHRHQRRHTFHLWLGLQRITKASARTAEASSLMFSVGNSEGIEQIYFYCLKDRESFMKGTGTSSAGLSPTSCDECAISRNGW